MTSVEGMWAFLSGSIENPEDTRDGGIVILETGRVFGGDSAMAYVGSYETAHDNKVRAEIRSWTWNQSYIESDAENVFGMRGAIDYEAIFEGTREDDEVHGHLYPKGRPEVRVVGVLKKITDLP